LALPLPSILTRLVLHPPRRGESWREGGSLSWRGKQREEGGSSPPLSTNVDSELTNVDSELTNVDSELTNDDSELTIVDRELANVDSKLTNIDSELTNVDS
jgi:hypothetical protein